MTNFALAAALVAALLVPPGLAGLATSIIHTVGYPLNDYESNQKIRYDTITSPPHSVIKLEFHSPFNLESAWMSESCYDFILIIDSDHTANPGAVCDRSRSFISRELCGHELPGPIYSSGTSLILEFCSDDSITMGGFYISASPVTPPTTQSYVQTPSLPEVCGAVPLHNNDVTFYSNHSVAQLREVSFIVGGQASPSHAWPWLVSVWKEVPGETKAWRQFCGGTVVNHNWILTAAHCFVKHGNLLEYRVKLGAYDKGTSSEATLNGEQTCGISFVRLHEEYDRDAYSNDVALVRLDCFVKFDDYVQPLCLQGTELGAYEKAAIAGWGHTSLAGPSSRLLKEAVVSVLPQDACKDAYPGEIDDSMICAAAAGTDSCQGDSGGPLMGHSSGGWYLAGVVSWGYGCADPKYPGVYANFHLFIDWAVDVMETYAAT